MTSPCRVRWVSWRCGIFGFLEATGIREGQDLPRLNPQTEVNWPVDRPPPRLWDRRESAREFALVLYIDWEDTNRSLHKVNPSAVGSRVPELS